MLLIGALTFFMLVASIGMVARVGNLVRTRVQLQHAADAAALAGAQIQANSLSRIAWINDGMAFIYYKLLRYAVDVATLAPLAELKEHGPPFPSDAQVGLPDAVGRYNTAYARANEWLPQGEEWLKILGHMQRAIALITPVMVEKEVYGIAGENGAEYAAVFPKFRMFPSPDDYISILVEQLPDGWRLTSSTDMVVEAIDKGDESWHIIYVDNNTNATVDIDKVGKDKFRITYIDGSGTTTTFIDRSNNVTVTSNNATVTSNADGSTTICENGTCVDVKTDPNGNLLTNNGSGWQPVGQQNSVNVNGATVRVQNNPAITVGQATVWPDHIAIGNTTITFSDPLRILSHFGPVAVRVEDDEASLNGLSTSNADCKWHRLWDDSTRHRLCELGPTTWEYEFQRNSSYLFEDDMLSFSMKHAMGDNDPVYDFASGAEPEWAKWFSPVLGRSSDAAFLHQTRPCWNSADADRDGFNDGTSIPCPICGSARYGSDVDGDGKREVRVHQLQTFVRQGNPGFDTPDRQRVDLSKFEMPLVLVEDFFKFGITVAVTSRTPQLPIFSSIFEDPRSGAFAIASARAGFWDESRGKYVYAFESIDDREQWIENSLANLYEPTWMAKLFPIAAQIKDEDIDSDLNDTGLNYLLRSLRHTEYRENYFTNDVHLSGRWDDFIAPWNGASLNLSDPDFQRVLKH